MRFAVSVLRAIALQAVAHEVGHLIGMASVTSGPGLFVIMAQRGKQPMHATSGFALDADQRYISTVAGLLVSSAFGAVVHAEDGAETAWRSETPARLLAMAMRDPFASDVDLEVVLRHGGYRQEHAEHMPRFWQAGVQLAELPRKILALDGLAQQLERTGEVMLDREQVDAWFG